MLLRTSLAVRETPKRKRWRRLFKHPETSVRALSGDDLKWNALCRNTDDLLVIDESLVPDDDPAVLEHLKLAGRDLASVVILCTYEPEDLMKFRGVGILGSLLYEAEDATIQEAVDTLVGQRRDLVVSNTEVKRHLARPELSDFVTKSPAMRRFIDKANRLCQSEVPVLITGETGAGKERLARSLHAASPRSQEPFIAVNCGAIPDNLVESELFGHVEGAFTGASRARRGCFELAHRGTLFLDEIGEVPKSTQVKLLRVLQEFEVTPVGAERAFTVDVRIIAATNRNLKEEIEAKNFRMDLFYRVAVLELHLPPLRERREDIPELAESFVENIAARIGKPVPELTSEALDMLMDYGWPGNIRELINIIERAILLCDGDPIGPAHLPDDMLRSVVTDLPADSALLPAFFPEDWQSLSLKEAREQLLDTFERVYLEWSLAACGGKVGEVAERAGIDNRTLFNKMKKFGLKKEDFREE